MMGSIKRLINALLMQVVFLPILAVGYVLVMTCYVFREVKLIPFIHFTFVTVVRFAWRDALIYIKTGNYGGNLSKLQGVFESFNDNP
jgi:hypothetical protein